MENMLILATMDFAFFKAVFLCAIALGLIIFIHELGHFLVAKACGVRCDKFYIGFDFFGLKLLKFKYGETEYGIGVFPLGGYVKMLGQEDNPGETRERIAKAEAARKILQQDRDSFLKEMKSLPQTNDSDAPTAEGPFTEEEIAAAEKQIDEDIEAAKNLINDPRSYQAKSVPQRLAIIVAGVTMNVILAFIAAVCAFMLGTFKIPCEIGSVHPGQAAWEAGLQADDRLLQIEKNELTYFDDISKNVMLGNRLDDGIQILVKRNNLPTDFAVTAFPKKYSLSPMLGATQSVVPVLGELPVTPASPASTMERELLPGDVLVGINDRPVKSNLDYQKALYATTGENVTFKFLRPSEEAQEKRREALKELKLGDYAEEEIIEADYVQNAEEFQVMAAPMKARNFGIVLAMGPVQSIRSNQNGLEGAGRAGIQVGDLIVGFEMTIDGKPQMIRNPDPMKLPFMIQTQTRFLANQAAAKKLNAAATKAQATSEAQAISENQASDAVNASETVEIAETPQTADAPQTEAEKALATVISTFQPADASTQSAEEKPEPLKFIILKKESGKEETVLVEFSQDVFSADQYLFGCGEVLPEIGLTYEIKPEAAAVLPGTEAEKIGVKPGFTMKSIAFTYEEPGKLERTEKEKKIAEQFGKKMIPHIFRPNVATWSMVYHNFMLIYPLLGTKAEIVFEDPATKKTLNASLPLAEYEDAYAYHSDLNFESRRIFIKEGFGNALILGGKETWNSLTLVYQMLGKLFSGQVSVKGLGGPVLIAQVAYSSAREGLSRLLMFVCLISANLAVLNLLPIPVLDGGHVVFLLWEGITGKAPNSTLVVILSYLGLLLFLGLTIFVLGLDLGFIPRF